MTDIHKLEKIKAIINGCNDSTLWTNSGRGQLSKQISLAIGMFENRVRSFVDEMYGLALGNSEDREIFMQFVERGL